MPLSDYHIGILHLDDVPLTALADKFGTPLYAYSQRDLTQAAQALDKALVGPTPHLICYAVKANPTLAIIQTFARLGFGADVTSEGELFRALQAGVPADRIVFSGVGKTDTEIRVGLQAGIKAFHVESHAEIDSIAAIAADLRLVAPIALRLNPDVDPHTLPGISTGKQENKFGIAWDQTPRLLQQVFVTPSLRLVGLSVHIGSQITEISPYREAAARVAGLARQMLDQGAPLEYVDFGGGLGVRYVDEEPPSFSEWGGVLREAMGDLPLGLLVEPGRSLVAQAGVLLARVLRIKHAPTRTFVIVDAGMNDLIRPMLYHAYHPILPVTQRNESIEQLVDIVGPICETTDTFASERPISVPHPGDLLAILHAGAYGSSMASNYNSRRRPAEVLIGEDSTMRLIRARENLEDLIRGEHLLPYQVRQ